MAENPTPAAEPSVEPEPKPPNNGNTCGLCKCCEPSGDGGLCHCLPKSATGAYPFVDLKEDWCGQFQPLKRGPGRPRKDSFDPQQRRNTLPVTPPDALGEAAMETPQRSTTELMIVQLHTSIPIFPDPAYNITTGIDRNDGLIAVERCPAATRLTFPRDYSINMADDTANPVITESPRAYREWLLRNAIE